MHQSCGSKEQLTQTFGQTLLHMLSGSKEAKNALIFIKMVFMIYIRLFSMLQNGMNYKLYLQLVKLLRLLNMLGLLSEQFTMVSRQWFK